MLPRKSRFDTDFSEWRSARVVCIVLGIAAIGAMSGAAGCPGNTPIYNSGGYNNTTDPTNGGASYIGSKACSACHPSVASIQLIHGHANVLSPITGGAPTFPSQATRAGVPNPPDGFQWSDISYVLGGYIKVARFLDKNGFFLTTGQTGKATQWLLNLPPPGITAKFDSYLPSATTDTPFDYSCFKCHTTGPAPQSTDNPMSQDGRPGILGTWTEPAVHCEACHGPGSNHIPNPSARANYVDQTGAQTCGRCHGKPDNADAGDVLVSNGFIQHNQQWVELRASGGHSGFACGYCHDPHRSVAYDRDNALVNQCRSCHPDQNMALHSGKVFTRGSYTETLTCESCHMPFAGLVGNPVGPDVVGPYGHIGDTRAHVFRISSVQADYHSCISDDGTKLLLDSQGRAALTTDFVCLRCHNEVSLPTLAFTPERAGEIAANVHLPSSINQKSKP